VASLVFAGQTHRGFPSVVRRLNMLRPARYVRSGEEGPGFSTYVSDWSKPANYLKDWLPFNLADEGGSDVDTATFGGYTTAPDATTDTSRKLVETAANSQHSAIAGWVDVNQQHYGKLRLAGIFKYAGRRVVLEMTTQGTGSTKFGCKAVFDLVNGRVAVDTMAFGSPDTAWTLYPAQIFDAGAGHYLCFFDAECNVNASGMASGIYGKVYLDNGVGLAAESRTYVGDGTSGVYGWRTNMLPTRAWDLQTVVFEDDFDDDTMANIDLTNSLAAGYDWYINNDWPSYEPPGNHDIPVTDITKLSVSGSVLTCSSHPVPLFMGTAASTWKYPAAVSHGWVGTGWTGSMLREYRAKWDISLSNQGDAATGWGAGVEFLAQGASRSDVPAFPSIEIDDFEALRGGYPRTSVLYYPAGPGAFISENQAIGISSVGIDVWYAGHSYFTGESVTRLGTAYTALAPTTGEPPESSPLAWGTYAQAQVGAQFPVGDYTNFHDYATLRLRYDSVTGELGQVLQFYDGAMSAFLLTYGPGLTGNVQSDVVHLTDDQTLPVFLGCGPDMGISFDWVRVTQ
jgi:hypothetical protein